jgi:hypothetical protein
MPTQKKTFYFSLETGAPNKALTCKDVFPSQSASGYLSVWKIKGKSRSRWREFHYWNGFNTPITYGNYATYLSLGSVKPHDVLHMGTNQWRRNPPSGEVLYVWVQEIDKEKMECLVCDNATDALSMLYKAKVAKVKWKREQDALRQQRQANIVSEREILAAYVEYLDADSLQDKIISLAKAIDWTERAVQMTLMKGALPADAEKRWKKASAIRQRAAHETTPIHEKETCMRMALRTMEPLVMPDLQYVTLEKAQTDPDTVKAAWSQVNKVKKVAATTRPVTTAPPPPGQAAWDVKDIADRIEQILGAAECSVKESKIRISIVYYPHGGKPLFAMFAKSKTVQIMCAVGDQIGWPDTDSAGTPCVNLPKPVNLTVVEEIATKVKALY